MPEEPIRLAATGVDFLRRLASGVAEGSPVLDIAFIAGILALVALVALVAKAVEKL